MLTYMKLDSEEMSPYMILHTHKMLRCMMLDERERESHCQNLELKLRRKTPRLEAKDSFHVTKTVTRLPDWRKDHSLQRKTCCDIYIYMQFTTSIIIIIISLLDTARSLYIKHY